MNRQPIYDALVTQLQLIQQPPYKIPIPGNIQEGYVPWDDGSLNMPCIFVSPEEENAIYEKAKIFLKWHLKLAIWIYAQKQGSQLGVQTLSVIQDAIEKVLMPQPGGNPMGPPGGVNTLGGLVQYVAISGPTVISPGYLGPIAVARMPVEILVA